MFNKFCEGFFKFFNTFGELILFIAGSLVFTCSITLLVSTISDITFFAAFIKVHIFYAIIAVAIVAILFIVYIYDKGEEITQTKQQETINAIKDNKYEDEITKYIKNNPLDKKSYAAILKSAFPKGKIYYNKAEDYTALFKYRRNFYIYSGLAFITLNDQEAYDVKKDCYIDCGWFVPLSNVPLSKRSKGSEKNV